MNQKSNRWVVGKSSSQWLDDPSGRRMSGGDAFIAPFAVAGTVRVRSSSCRPRLLLFEFGATLMILRRAPEVSLYIPMIVSIVGLPDAQSKFHYLIVQVLVPKHEAIVFDTSIPSTHPRDRIDASCHHHKKLLLASSLPTQRPKNLLR